MSESLGPITYENRWPDMLGMLQAMPGEPDQHSEETLQEIDREVRRIVDESREKVQKLLNRERSALDVVAERLLEKEVVEGEELQEILDKHAPKGGRDGGCK